MSTSSFEGADEAVGEVEVVDHLLLHTMWEGCVAVVDEVLTRERIAVLLFEEESANGLTVKS